MFRIDKRAFSCIETPCVAIDVELAKANIFAMQEAITETGCALRPHIKTHKMPYFAKLQLAAGCSGITCCKISEAEVMAESGINDIFIAYPIIGEIKLEKALLLKRKVKRLILAVDSLEGATEMGKVAVRNCETFEVRMEIDTGCGRTGVPIFQAVELAKKISSIDGLNLTGIFTFKGMILKRQRTFDNKAAAEEEACMMREAYEKIVAAGIDIKDISAGSTPTGLLVAKTGLVTEVRQGTYPFKDIMLCKENVATEEEIAVRYIVTVVSAHHKEYAVVDGGTKFFATDSAPDKPPFFFEGYAKVDGNEDLVLQRMNEEHGIIISKKGNTGLKVGDKLLLMPNHVCTAINNQNGVYLFHKNRVEYMEVAARGMTK